MCYHVIHLKRSRKRGEMLTAGGIEGDLKGHSAFPAPTSDESLAKIQNVPFSSTARPGDFSDARPKRLRFLVFNTVGTVIHHARRTLLRLTAAVQQALLALARSKILALSPA